MRQATNSLCHFNFSHISPSLSVSLALALSRSLLLSLSSCVCGLYVSENYSLHPAATGHSAVRKHSFRTVKQNEHEANHKGASWLWLDLGSHSSYARLLRFISKARGRKTFCLHFCSYSHRNTIYQKDVSWSMLCKGWLLKSSQVQPSLPVLLTLVERNS